MRSPIRLSSPLMRYAALVVDVLLIWACGLAAYTWQSATAQFALPSRYELVVLGATLLWVLMSGSIQRSWRLNSLFDMVRTVATGWMVAVLAIVVWLFLMKSSAYISRQWFTEWTLAALLALCLQRVLVMSLLRLLRRAGYNYKSVLVVGSGPASRQVLQALADANWSGMHVLAAVTPAALADVLAQPMQDQPDEVWLCLALGDHAGIEAAMEALKHSTANIRLVPDLYEIRLINHGISEVLGIPMLDISASPITGMTRLVKAAQDRIGALLILTIIAVPMLVIALAIKFTSKGPVLFKQLRHGWNGEDIWIYKFRSMTVHQEGNARVTQASKNDARITPLGAFLRRTSLDELPQFINVLQGRMSIVGPRPHAVQHNEHYKELVPGYMLRHKVKPGITGWAQINGFRGETDTLEKMEKRVEYDLYYIENLSLWLDLKIIFMTIFKGWVHENAY